MKKLPSGSLQKERTMTEIMDCCISSTEEELDGASVCRIILEVFRMDLNKAPLLDKAFAKHVADTPSSAGTLSEAAVDAYIKQHGKCASGAEVRAMLNQLFGTNLEGISALHQQRISLYSKSQWIVQNQGDLFIVHTGKDDIDAQIMPTPYFTEKTGLDRLPEALQQALSGLGYSYNEALGAYYFCNPSGEAVPDIFKRQTMGTIHEVIQKHYADL
jgi:hypothetical protein